MIFQYPLKLRLTVCRPKLLFAMCLRALDLRPRMKTIVGAIQSPLPGPHHFTRTEGHFSWEGAADKDYAYSWDRNAATKFLRLVNYCRAWIPDCAYHDKDLRCRIQHGMGPRHTGLLKRKNISMHWRLLSHALLPWGYQTIPGRFTYMRGEAVGVAMVDPRAWWQTIGPWYNLIPSCYGCSGGDG